MNCTLPQDLRRADVSVLFIDPKGPYPDLVVDTWDAARDARLYDGPHPVVAHPPCQLWTNFAHVNYKRYGGGHNRPGNDGGMFASALASVRRWGGVLEHPADSAAWPAHGLIAPSSEPRWKQTALCEWTCEVWQSAWGHPARKRTWLFYCGRRPPLEARWERTPGTHQVGWFDRNKPTLGKKAASRTPDQFALWLVELAAHSRGNMNDPMMVAIQRARRCRPGVPLGEVLKEACVLISQAAGMNWFSVVDVTDEALIDGLDRIRPRSGDVQSDERKE